MVLSRGLLPDSIFKPLHDVSSGKRKHIPKLAHGLDAVLRKEGVHWLKDPETGRYNFPEHLEQIPKVEDFAFDRLPGFLPSSQDKKLLSFAKKSRARFAGSTSSLTGILTQIYLLLSEEKMVNISNLSVDFDKAPRYFTPGQRIPTSVILHYHDGAYFTDYDSERDESTEDIILLPMGILLEKFFTLPKETFDKFRKAYTGTDYPILKDTHRFAKHKDLLMRSQLDCRDDHLPGTGVFDIKTRAISEIRHDVYNYANYENTKIDSLTGASGSFEKEYYDMIRAAFLEYSFQARIGNMDGVFVAYHNVAQIFGFQYISLREMDRRLFGREGAGARVFERCVALMELLYQEIVKCFPRRSVKVTFEKRHPVVRAWVEPVVNPTPDAEPPVVELQLSLKNIVRGKAAPGHLSVGSRYPWSVQWCIERSMESQEKIRASRNIAYQRQLSIASSLPTERDVSQEPSEAALEEIAAAAEEADVGVPPSDVASVSAPVSTPDQTAQPVASSS
ncbi:Pet127-domain-containing protein [Trametes coccinea BRFM310]|uniref:Pet127-domain-containing protein n=1 Tax=Trametes coccinea (strain BRFM310) TaxID=1353009 RepID=A0A1Y2J1A3_TRAC3|nr:Pet127-domain-containing protein [Trametes coccinea BRFM310]